MTGDAEPEARTQPWAQPEVQAGIASAPQIAALLPEVETVAFELWGHGDESVLLPEEAALVDGAVLNRRRQFAAGRSCAHLALRELSGIGGFDRDETQPLLVGERRSPRWPGGVTGSISHTDGYAVAVVAASPASAPYTIGIDAEGVGRVFDKLYERLFVTSEREHLATLSTVERDVAATVMFGAKEAFYKAQFPVTEAWVGFHDVELVPDDGGFLLHQASDLEALDVFAWPLRALSIVRNGVVVTAVVAHRVA